MAKDDINVIMYKILKYLYECKKAGIRPSEEDIVYNSKLLNIPRLYWEDVILELGEKGFINGIQKITTKDGIIVTFGERFGISIDGMKYVDENAMMAKVEEELGSAFKTVLNTIIEIALNRL